MINWTKLAGRRNRESVLNDAKSIAPMSLSAFDTNKYLLNLQNGTLNLQTFTRQDHNPADYITKITRVRFDPKAKCPRWEQFIDEVMCGDKDTALFLQKGLGYALTGDTNAHNNFYILYGHSLPATENPRLQRPSATFWAIMPGRYNRRRWRSVRRMARLRRPILRGSKEQVVCTPEPEKGLEINSALIKQLTGGGLLQKECCICARW